MAFGPKCARQVRRRCLMQAVQQGLVHFQQLLPSEFGPLPDTEKPEKMFFFPLQTGALISGGPPHTVLIFMNHESFSSLQMFHSWLSDSLFLLKLFFFSVRAVSFFFFFCSASDLTDLSSFVPFLRGEHVPVVYHHQGGQNYCAAPAEAWCTEAVRRQSAEFSKQR